MTTLADPKDLLAEHTSALTAYAERVFGRHAPAYQRRGSRQSEAHAGVF